MGDLRKALERLGSDALGGGIRIGHLGMCLFEILEFAEELVVISVGNFGFGLGVVEMVVVANEMPELRDPLFGGGWGRRRGRAGTWVILGRVVKCREVEIWAGEG